jgi:hypothetical protein
MMRTVQTFDRGDHFCVVDTRSGSRVVTYPKKGPDGLPLVGAPAPAARVPRADAGPPPKPPTLLRKGFNFVVAGVVHLATGMGQSGDAVIAERFESCRACSLFKPSGSRETASSGECSHPSCGCNLRNVGVEGINKLAWAESTCPLPSPRWGPVRPADALP